MNLTCVGLLTIAGMCMLQVQSLFIPNQRRINISEIVELTCDYVNDATPLYTCILYNLNITTSAEVKAIGGSHLPDKSDSDVQQIIFQNGTMFYIPNGIGSIFPNVEKIVVGDLLSMISLDTKEVTRTNFENFNNLQEIALNSDVLRKIDKDALWDLSDLKIFTLSAQRLNFLNVRTFERNTKLMGIAIVSTELRELYANTFRYNPLLQGIHLENNVIEEIEDGTFKWNPKLEALSLASNKLTTLRENMFESNEKLWALDFTDNSLEVIKIDFTTIEAVQLIILENNNCIDDIYDSKYDGHRPHRYNNLTEFQNLINSKCKSSTKTNK